MSNVLHCETPLSVCHIAWQLSSLTFCIWQLFNLLFGTNRITIYTSVSAQISGKTRLRMRYMLCSSRVNLTDMAVCQTLKWACTERDLLNKPSNSYLECVCFKGECVWAFGLTCMVCSASLLSAWFVRERHLEQDTRKPSLSQTQFYFPYPAHFEHSLKHSQGIYDASEWMIHFNRVQRDKYFKRQWIIYTHLFWAAHLGMCNTIFTSKSTDLNG